MLIDKGTHRRRRLIRAVADGGSAIEISRNLLAEGDKAAKGVEQQNGEECDREKLYGMSQWEENNARDKTERSQPGGRCPLALHLLQRLAVLRHILVGRRESAGTFDCFGNLTKALPLFPECAACVAECRVSEHAGLIHALDPGHDPGLQQQLTLFDQIGHFREAQPGIAEGLRGAVLGGLGHGRILRVHLLHGLFQECQVIDHRKTAPATVASIVQLVRQRSLAQRTVALECFPTIAGLAGTGPRPSVAAVSTLFIGNCAGKLHL